MTRVNRSKNLVRLDGKIWKNRAEIDKLKSHTLFSVIFSDLPLDNECFNLALENIPKIEQFHPLFPRF